MIIVIIMCWIFQVICGISNAAAAIAAGAAAAAAAAAVQVTRVDSVAWGVWGVTHFFCRPVCKNKTLAKGVR